jgi:hypothetical protein
MRKQPTMDLDREVTDFADDDTRKNPIHIQLRSYDGPLSEEQLGRVVARSRDFFHTFVTTTLRRRYRRLVPIYLVDDWVVNALGVFVERGGRRLPGIRHEESPLGSRRVQEGQIRFHGAVEGLEPLLEMFAGLSRVEAMLGGAQILMCGSGLKSLKSLCEGLAAGSHHVEAIGRVCAEIEALVSRATETLLKDPAVADAVDETFCDYLGSELDAVLQAAQRAAATPPPAVPGTGFGPGRWSGVLFGNIPALNITGPAILVAPRAVTRWVREFGRLDWMLHELNPDGMDTWFGVHEPEHFTAAVGLSNVVQHELTHAMVALPNDPVEGFEALFEARWSFYQRAPGFEEGLCDATAAIATTVTLLKARFGITGRKMPRLHEGRYAQAWDQCFPAIAETYAAYSGPDTDTWLQAWHNNNRDFGAFSGLVKLYSTNFSGSDWDKTFDEFKAGRISTGR